MVYHSSRNDAACRSACGCAMLPLRTGSGPAPAEAGDQDVLDEVLSLLRANVLFKQFDIKGPADRLLVYLTLYCSSLLSKLPADAAAAKRTLPSLAAEGYSVPGDAGFRLGAYFPRPGSDAERDELRAYLKQARDEIATRLVGKCYNADGSRNKWWFAFEKRQFMGLDGV